MPARLYDHTFPRIHSTPQSVCTCKQIETFCHEIMSQVSCFVRQIDCHRELINFTEQATFDIKDFCLGEKSPTTENASVTSFQFSLECSFFEDFQMFVLTTLNSKLCKV